MRRRREPGPARGAISFCHWWSGEHCRRTWPAGGEAVFPGVIYLLRLGPGGRGIGVDPLATELIIDRRLAHGATP